MSKVKLWVSVTVRKVKSKMITIKDVAREANVAISTVSNVINGVDIVSEETKQKVLSAVDKLKYVPNYNARALKTSKKNTIGLFLSDIQEECYGKLVQAVHLQCKNAGFMLNICVSNENTGEETYGMILASGVEGAIIMSEVLENEYIERLSNNRFPIVFIDREYCGEYISSVTMDSYKDYESKNYNEYFKICPDALKDYSISVADLGTNAARELIRMMKKEGNSVGRCIKLVPSFVVRDSETRENIEN